MTTKDIWKKPLSLLMAIIIMIMPISAFAPEYEDGMQYYDYEYDYDYDYADYFPEYFPQPETTTPSAVEPFFPTAPAPFGADVVVNSHGELVDAINTAPTDGTQRVITLGSSFTQTAAIPISGGRSIHLISYGTDLDTGTGGTRHTLFAAAMANARHFNIQSGSGLTLTNIVLDGNRAATGNRGGISIQSGSNGTLTMRANSVIQNTRASLGGAVDVAAGNQNARIYMYGNALITDNLASMGGGVNISGGATFTMLDSTEIASNNGGNGGGVDINGGTFIMRGNSRIHDNTVGNNGGGANITNAVFEMYDNSAIYNNRTTTANTGVSSGLGGGINIVRNSTITMNGNSSIHTNEARNNGGGANIDMPYHPNFPPVWGQFDNLGNSALIMRDNAIIHNNTATNGGGVRQGSGEINMYGNALITGNFAAQSGGGVSMVPTVITHASGSMIPPEVRMLPTVTLNMDASMNSAAGIVNNRVTNANHNTIHRSYAGGGGIFANGRLNERDGDPNNPNPPVTRAFINIRGGRVADNTVTSSTGGIVFGGGGIHHVWGTQLTVADGAITNNHVISTGTNTGKGGGIFTTGGTPQYDGGHLIMQGGTVRDNTAHHNGGGIAVAGYGQQVQMSGGTITGNHAFDGNGGGIHFARTGSPGNVLNIENGVTISHNTANHGGGVYLAGISLPGERRTLNMTGGVVEHNTARDNAGGVHISSGCTFNMTGGSVTNNTAARWGGGVAMPYGSGNNYFTMLGGSMTNNAAHDGGGLGISHATTREEIDSVYNRVEIAAAAAINQNTAAARFPSPWLEEQNPQMRPSTVDILSGFTNYNIHTVAHDMTPPTIAKTADPTTAYVGDTITYTISVTNPNPFPVGLVVGDNLDLDLVQWVVNSLNLSIYSNGVNTPAAGFGSHSVPTTGTTRGQLRIKLPEIPANATINVTFDVDALVAANLRNQAMLIGAGPQNSDIYSPPTYVTVIQPPLTLPNGNENNENGGNQNGSNQNNGNNESSNNDNGDSITLSPTTQQPPRPPSTPQPPATTPTESQPPTDWPPPSVTPPPPETLLPPQPPMLPPGWAAYDLKLPTAYNPIPLAPYHPAYIIGYPDGYVRPGSKITRAEVATIFFRLISDEYLAQIWNQDNPFPDVELENWFNNAISTLSGADLLRGYPDGYFRPNNEMTRAEFAALIVRVMGYRHAIYNRRNGFADINGHWAAGYINVACMLSWVQGYGQEEFRPNQFITRAEAAALVNRALGRLPQYPGDLLPDMVTWPDNMNLAAWYYLYIQEATNSHYHVYKADGIHETWTGLITPREWWRLERPYSRPQDILR